jgi:hypothetical protein
MPSHRIAATTPSVVIVVPRDKENLYHSLRRVFADDLTVDVTVDRRLGERRAASDMHAAERRRGDRRRRAGMDSELRAGRWIVVPRATGSIDSLDVGALSILFLCCSHHVVPCQQCQNTYRLAWIRRVDDGRFACPLCETDLTDTVLAHAEACHYWESRRRTYESKSA